MLDKVASEIFQRIVYAGVRREVFKRLGTLPKDLPKDGLTEEEVVAASPIIINMMEKATADFFADIRGRMERKKNMRGAS
jgi:hypothetical protein